MRDFQYLRFLCPWGVARNISGSCATTRGVFTTFSQNYWWAVTHPRFLLFNLSISLIRFHDYKRSRTLKLRGELSRAFYSLWTAEEQTFLSFHLHGHKIKKDFHNFKRSREPSWFLQEKQKAWKHSWNIAGAKNGTLCCPLWTKSAEIYQCVLDSNNEKILLFPEWSEGFKFPEVSWWGPLSTDALFAF